MQLVLDHTQDVAKDTRTFWFRPDLKPHYLAGQFIELIIPHTADDRGTKRWFTLSSSPTEPLLAITTRYSPRRVSTFKRQLFALKPGMAISAVEPMGDFVLPVDKTIPLLFVAAGIGITPVRSIVKQLADTNERRDIHIIYGSRAYDYLAFLNLFERYGAKTDIVLSHPDSNWEGLTGHLSGRLVTDRAGRINDRGLYYISVPEALVEKIETQLKALAVPAEKLVLDFYHGYTV